MLQPGKKLGPFVIEKELGSGAMGTVYLAKYSEKNIQVAIKVMAPGVGSSETALVRFEREAEVLKQLKHPHIVRLLATGRLKRAPFYAMEYIQGESLDRALERRKRVGWEEVVTLGRQLCSALQLAHEKGIIHRDLKPSNLMLLPDGTLKLTDFGIAKIAELDGLTKTNCTVGTASYMSPEQCHGNKDLTSKSDLYSLGVVLFELITGRKPFQAESVVEMFLKHAKEKPPRPSRFVMDIPVWLDNLICQLLEKKPDERPYDAQKVSEALAQIQEKVQTQHSAGLDRIQSRRGSRLRSASKLDETDKQVARSLLNKKKKTKKTPIHEQTWLRALVLLVLLAIIAATIYWTLLRPPSLESLHEQTATLMADENFENALAAMQGPLRSFSRYYADDVSDNANQMRQWADDANRRVYGHWLHSRLEATEPDLFGEADAREALRRENDGDLTGALKLWQKLAMQKSNKHEEIHGWGLVGESHVAALDRLDAKMNKLRDKVNYNPKYKGKSPEEELAVKAIRAQINGNKDTAKTYWQDLLKEAKVKTESRQWRLMAAYRIWEMNHPPDEPKKE